MTKKTLLAIAAFTLALACTACADTDVTDTSMDADSATVSTSDGTTADTTADADAAGSSFEESAADSTVVTTEDTASTESAEASPFYEAPIAEPPLSEEELSMAVPDFLNEEQQMLYRRASNVYSHLFGISSTFVEYKETLDYHFNEYEYFENQYHWRYLISQGRYQDWDDFMELVLSVFTENFFNTHNNDESGEQNYVECNGKLAFCDWVSSGSQFYNDNFEDEFELVSMSNTEIVFHVIGHYSQTHPQPGESFAERDARCAAGWEATDKFTIRMVLTDSGWRFDEFYDTSIDERTSMFIDDLGWDRFYILDILEQASDAATDEANDTLDLITSDTTENSIENELSFSETVINDYAVSPPHFQSYFSKTDGYGISGYDNAAGKEYHNLYYTSNGGDEWIKIDTNIDQIYPRVVSGISFKDKSVGFIVFRYGDDDFSPAILKTIDGETWQKVTSICELLKDYADQGYMMEASAPVFDEDGVCTMDITAIRHDDDGNSVINFSVVSEDYENWSIK